MDNKDIKIICLTPVKNDAWILELFLKCASVWADHIIIADQSSHDGSAEIASKYPKVRLIKNTSASYDEGLRQGLLMSEARKIPGRRLIVALDADEILTAGCRDSEEWNSMLSANPGAVILMERVNLMPGFKSCWIPQNKNYYPFAFMDDGSAHSGHRFHSPRVPLPASSPRITLRRTKVMHYQHVDHERMKRKQHWYQCQEIVRNPRAVPTEMYRLYNRIDGILDSELHPAAPEWFEGYRAAGIDMTNIGKGSNDWYNKEVVEMLIKYGPAKFKKASIWDVDWVAVSEELGYGAPGRSLRDPRNYFDKAVHRYLARTQKAPRSFFNRAAARVLRLFKW